MRPNSNPGHQGKTPSLNKVLIVLVCIWVISACWIAKILAIGLPACSGDLQIDNLCPATGDPNGCSLPACSAGDGAELLECTEYQGSKWVLSVTKIVDSQTHDCGSGLKSACVIQRLDGTIIDCFYQPQAGIFPCPNKPEATFFCCPPNS